MYKKRIIFWNVHLCVIEPFDEEMITMSFNAAEHISEGLFFTIRLQWLFFWSVCQSDCTRPSMSSMCPVEFVMSLWIGCPTPTSFWAVETIINALTKPIALDKVTSCKDAFGVKSHQKPHGATWLDDNTQSLCLSSLGGTCHARSYPSVGLILGQNCSRWANISQQRVNISCVPEKKFL